MNLRFSLALSALLLLPHTSYAQVRKSSSKRQPNTEIKPRTQTKTKVLSQAQLHQALINAVNADNVARAANLIRQGAKANWAGPYGLPLIGHAVVDGQLEMVKLLISKGASLKAHVRGNDTLLITAIDRSHLDVALALVNAGADFNTVGEDERLPLELLGEVQIPEMDEADVAKYPPNQRKEALGELRRVTQFKQQAASLVKMLIAKGADPNKISPKGYLPLLVAVERGNYTVALPLLELGANPNLVQEPFPSPLRLLCQAGSAGQLDAFIGEWTDGSLTIQERDTALAKAEARDILVANLMFSKGLDLSKGDNRFALAEAAQRGHGKMVRLLLEHGADPNIALVPERITLSPLERSNFRYSPEEAAQSEKELNASKEDPSELIVNYHRIVGGAGSRNRAGQTALSLAAVAGHSDVVKQLLDKKANAASRDKAGRTALALLAGAGRTSSILDRERSFASVSGGARNMGWLSYDIVAPLPANITRPLIQWASQGDSAVASALLAHGCPVNLADNKGITPLQSAVLQSSPSVVETLLQAGATIPSGDKKQPLLNLVINGGRRERRSLPMLTTMQLVFVQIEEIEGRRPRIVKDKSEAAEIAKEDVEYSRIRREMFKQRRYLLSTWGQEDAAVVRSLIKHGAPVDAKDGQGLTALMRSARAGQIGITRELLKAGADANATNNNGETVIMQVIAYGLRHRTLNDPLSAGEHRHQKATAALAPAGRVALFKKVWGSEDKELITLLIQHGANKGRKNRQGQTAIMLANKFKHSEAIAALK